MGPATTAISRLHLVTDARPGRDVLGLLRVVLAIVGATVPGRR